MYRSEELLESFNRLALIMFMRNHAPRFKFNKSSNNYLSYSSRKGKTFDLNTMKDSAFRPELQEMFSRSMKVGYLLRKAKKSSPLEFFLIILTNIGLLLLNPRKNVKSMLTKV